MEGPGGRALRQRGPAEGPTPPPPPSPAQAPPKEEKKEEKASGICVSGLARQIDAGWGFNNGGWITDSGWG